MSKHKPIPFTQPQLRMMFKYKPDTGMLIRQPKLGGDKYSLRYNKMYANQVIRGKDKLGYIVLRYNNQRYQADRIIYKWWYGTEPKYIEHLNGDKSDNRIINLKGTDIKPTRSDNSSGHTGVFINENNFSKPFQALWYEDGKKKVKSFETIEEAIEFRKLKTDEI